MLRKSLPFFLILPITIILIGIILVPSVWSIYLSAFEVYPGRFSRYIGIRNYVYLFNDSTFWVASINTVIFMFGTVIIEFFSGLAIALFFSSKKFMFNRIWISLLLAPYVVSPVFGALAFKLMLDPDFGIVNYILSFFGIPLGTVGWYTSPQTSLFTVILLEAWQHTPFMFLILYSAIISLPPSPLEAARVDGATKWQVFRYITMPLIQPAALVGLLFRIVFSMRAFPSIWLLTAGGPGISSTTQSVYLYNYLFHYREVGYASAVSLIMLLFTIAVSIPYIRLMYKKMFGE